MQFGTCVYKAFNEVCFVMLQREYNAQHPVESDPSGGIPGSKQAAAVMLDESFADTMGRIPEAVLGCLPLVWRRLIEYCLLSVSSYHLAEALQHSDGPGSYFVPLLYFIHRPDVALNWMHQHQHWTAGHANIPIGRGFTSGCWVGSGSARASFAVLCELNRQYSSYRYFRDGMRAPRDGKFESAESLAGVNGLLQEHDLDGLRAVEQSSYEWRFTEDDRMHEVCRLVRSSRPLYLRLDKTPETSNAGNDIAAFRAKQQERLLALCRRSLALPIGRGMVTLGTLTPMLAESIPIPPLPLMGRVPPNDSLVALDATASSPALTLWPEFHNGVAAGLRLYHANTGALTPGSNTHGLTRSWVQYMRASPLSPVMGPNNLVGAKNNTLAGVLLSLGLMRALTVLSTRDILDLLSVVCNVLCSVVQCSVV